MRKMGAVRGEGECEGRKGGREGKGRQREGGKDLEGIKRGLWSERSRASGNRIVCTSRMVTQLSTLSSLEWREGLGPEEHVKW